jgi:hypothetical protein
MLTAAKYILKETRNILNAFGKRNVEKYFQNVDQFRAAPARKLSDFTLLRGYKVLMDEIENESNSNVRQLLVNSLLEIETELKKRNLLNEAILSQ